MGGAATVERTRLPSAKKRCRRPFPSCGLGLPIAAPVARAPKLPRLVRSRQNVVPSAKNQRLKLSPKEFDLLMYLLKNKERVVPRDELLSRVWNYRVDLNLNSRTVDTHVTRLRRKLQKAVGTEAAVIVAVANIGYRYLGEASTAS